MKIEKLRDNKCKICNKETCFMYKINDGLYCEKCLKIGKVKMKMKLLVENVKNYVGSKGTN